MTTTNELAESFESATLAVCDFIESFYKGQYTDEAKREIANVQRRREDIRRHRAETA